MTSSQAITKLTGSNYPTWKIQVKMALLKDGLFGIVSGTETAPANGDDLANFNKRKDKALALIVLAIDTSLLYLIPDPENPQTVWEKLQGQFQKKSWANKLSLRKKLYALRLVEGGSIQDHLKTMTELFNELAIVGSPVDDEDKVVHLLASLPPTYDMLVTALEANEHVPTMEMVVERLLHTERKQTEGEKELGLVASRAQNAKGRMGQGQSHATRGPICYKCKSFGHIKKNCPLWQKSKKCGETVQKAESEFGILAAETALFSSTVSCEKWLIDSGATSHMCCNDAHFTDLQPLKHTVKVSIGDGHGISAQGIGSVHLKINCQGKSSSLHLRDVLYVPDLEYNLISISKAGKAGNVSRFDGSKCEIMNKEGTVLASGVCEGSLYSLTVENNSPDNTEFLALESGNIDNSTLQLIDCEGEDSDAEIAPEVGPHLEPDIEPEVEQHPEPEMVPEVEQHPEPEIAPEVDPRVEPIAVRRSTRTRKSPDRYGERSAVAEDDEAVKLACDSESPKSYSEAMNHPHRNSWKSAMADEMKSLKVNDVWDLVPRPAGRKVIGSKWVFKVKVAADGSVTRHKARLVAQGYSQKPGLDYDETFSPVVRSETVRTIFALCAQKGLLLHQMDVATAFLNGKLEEEVYMEQPHGYCENKDLVCKLKRSLYGLKQSPRCWNVVLDKHLKSIGFNQHKEDPCLYTATGGETVIVAVYVDDLLIAAENENCLDKVKKKIAQGFNMKDLGELQSFLGIQVKQNEDGVFINQPGYTVKVLEKFGMKECNPVATPVNVSQKLKKDDGDEIVSQSLYQSAVGSLLYLSGWTRPDIAFAVHNVAKFASHPTKQHWIAVKHIFRYIRGTMDHGILYKRGDRALVGYSDASWASDANDRKSVSGYIFTLAGAPISWRSKKQTTVALSTAEAEYIALSAAAQEAVWLQNLMLGLGLKISPTVINEDNQSAIAIAKNPQFHGRTKHVDIKYHFVRELVNKGTILVKYCATGDMLADLLTKGLAAPQHKKLITNLNMV